MNAIVKVSAFPATVQSGRPALPPPPTGWSQEPLGRYLEEVRRPVALCADDGYELVTAKRARGGIVHRERLTGRDISVKSQFRLKEGDFLISKRQIVHGACGLVPRDLEGAIVSNEYAVLRCRAGLDPRFLSYLTHTIHFQQTCFHSSIGVHVEKMIFKLDRWLKWKFNLPPLAEQRKIAEILATWDEAITTTEQLLANAEAQKQALANLVLAKINAPEKSLGTISTTFSGGTPSRDNPAFYGGSIPWLKSGELNAGRIIATEETITEAALEKSAAKIAKKGSILIAMYGATAGVIAVTEIDAAINQAILAVQPRPDIDRDYLLVMLQHKMRKAVGLVQGGQPNLNAGIIKAIRVPVPSLAKQRSVASLLVAAAKKVETLTECAELLRLEKAALMQQLLTGRRRVTV